MAIKIDEEKCTGCEVCMENCPNRAIFLLDNKAVINEDNCDDCGICVSVCPQQAIYVEKQEIKGEYPTIPVRTMKKNLTRVSSLKPERKKVGLIDFFNAVGDAVEVIGKVGKIIGRSGGQGKSSSGKRNFGRGFQRRRRGRWK